MWIWKRDLGARGKEVTERMLNENTAYASVDYILEREEHEDLFTVKSIRRRPHCGVDCTNDIEARQKLFAEMMNKARKVFPWNH